MAGSIIYEDAGAQNVTAAIRGDSWRRPFRCTGLTSGPAIADLADEVFGLTPNKGTSAPSPLSTMILDIVSIDRFWREAGSTYAASGSIFYRSPTTTTAGVTVPDADGPGVTQSTSVSSEEIETDVDRFGNQITTSYDNAVQAHFVRRQRELITHVFVRPEDANPRARRDTYQGKINSGTWNGYADGTVLLRTVNDETFDNAAWEVEYTFVYKPEGWNTRVVHEDPYFPGKPIPEAILSAPELALAVKDVELYDPVSFGPLNITLT